MWAAYQGDGISTDLLLKAGASVASRDYAGLTPLHWAVVKGSPACIKHLVEAGADMNIKEEQGKTPRDMADELKSTVPLTKALEQANCDAYGRTIQPRFGQRTTLALLFLVPIVALGAVFETFALLPAYLSLPLTFAYFYGMHYVSDEARVSIANCKGVYQSAPSSQACRRAYGFVTVLRRHHHRFTLLGVLLLCHSSVDRHSGIPIQPTGLLCVVFPLRVHVLQIDPYRPRVHPQARERRRVQRGH